MIEDGVKIEHTLGHRLPLIFIRPVLLYHFPFANGFMGMMGFKHAGSDGVHLPSRALGCINTLLELLIVRELNLLFIYILKQPR